MKLRVFRNNKTIKVEVNFPDPIIKFDFRHEEELDESYLRKNNIEIICDKTGLKFSKPLGIREHIVGLGEKAYPLDRRRRKLVMWNYDNFGYKWYSDPLYISIPFFISINEEELRGYFFNATSRIEFDIGVTQYDRILVKIPEESTEFYIFEGNNIEEIIEGYIKLTGFPLLPPQWVLGHQISRYSYYPQENVLRIVREYLKEFKVSAIYLDIDYMDNYKLFTWDKGKFPDPKSMIRELHEMGVRVITIVDIGIKLDQNYEKFKEGLGCYVKTENEEIYVETLWPGKCVFPDFLNESAVNKWKKWVSNWIKEYSIDGVWLDMNEPSIFSQSKTFSEDVVHLMGEKKIRHSVAHNAYSFYEAKSTYEALSELHERPFILSRSGYSGIQKYACVWTGDNTSSFEDILLQLQLIQSLSISGIPFVGCDLGGFTGNSSPELILAYYRASLFFPIIRNHKDKGFNDQELFLLPSKYKEEIKEVINLRYMFLPYMYSLAYEAHKLGHPIIRPLFYYYYDDDDTYNIIDEYMVGSALLYAPVLKGESREVYLPKGNWVSLFDFSEFPHGNHSIKSKFPIFMKNNSIILLREKLLVTGNSSFTAFLNNDEVVITFNGRELEMSKPIGELELVVLGDYKSSFNERGEEVKPIKKIKNATTFKFNSTYLKIVS
jgi:alpha-glucosidase